MAWIVRLVSIGAEGEEHSTDVMRIAKPDTLADLGTLGLSLAESKQLLAGIQREIVAAQARLHAMRRPACRGCGDVLPDEGLPPARDRHAVRAGRGPAAPFPLRRMRRDRGGRGMAAARPLDAGAGSAAGAALRLDDLPDGGRGDGAGVPGGRRRGSRDPAPPHLQDRRGAAGAGGDKAADRDRRDRGDLGLRPSSGAARTASGTWRSGSAMSR